MHATAVIAVALLGTWGVQAFKDTSDFFVPLLSPCHSTAIEASDTDGQIDRKCGFNQSVSNVYHINSVFPRLSFAYKPSELRYDAVIKYPSGTSWQPAQKYRLSICPLWGDAFPPPRFVCSLSGDAQIENHSVILPLPGALKCFHMDHQGPEPWPPIPTQTVSFENSAPAHLYDALVLAATVCMVDNTITVIRQGTGFSVEAHTEFRFPWGELHPEMWSELLLVVFLLVPKMAMALWFYKQCTAYRDSVMRIQWLCLGCLLLSLTSNIVFLGYLADSNVTGFRTIFPAPKQTIFMNFLRTVSDLVFCMLLLATAKGWGVVRPRLTRVEYQKLIAFAVLAIIVFALQHFFQQSIELVWMTLACDLFLVTWIFSAVKATKRDLGLSSRVDRTHKLDMYMRLHRLLCTSIQIWAMSIVLAILIVLLVFQNTKGLFVGYQIPPTMSWDLAMLVLQLGFAWIWAPSTMTALYSYTFVRQDLEQEDERTSAIDEEALANGD